jgi:formate hydrogenlyase transcriptional activator
MVQEIIRAVASCDDLPSAVACMEDMLRHVFDLERIILFLKESEAAKISIFYREGCAGTLEQLPGGEDTVGPVELQVDSFEPLWSNFRENFIFSPQSNEQHRVSPAVSNCLLLTLPKMRSVSGVLGLCLRKTLRFQGENEAFSQHLAAEVGIALENVIQRQRFVMLQTSLKRMNSHCDILRGFSRESAAKLDLQSLIDGISSEISRTFGTEILCLVTHRPNSEVLDWSALHLLDGKGPEHIGKVTSTKTVNGASIAVKTQKPFLADRLTMEQTSEVNCISLLLSQGAQTYYSVPLIYGGEVVGVAVPAHIRADRFAPEELRVWEDCAAQVSTAVECLLTKQEARLLRSQLSNTYVSVPYEVQHRSAFAALVGESRVLKEVFAQIELVAPTDSSVLIVGETGTGKGMMAQALHNLSNRKQKPLLQVNCATIPASLLESEMFGHEKGSFTGAASRRIGRLEQANGGTLFLDEIGEMPLELQPKLLRAVQEQRFERLGGTSSIQVDVRFIWATNRDLKTMVADKQFRSDLFYRLDVFPVVMPALRERVEDIPLLVHHFLQEFNQRMNKNINRVPTETMNGLMQRPWPGNVRELRNVIERAAIRSSGSTLLVNPEDLCMKTASSPSTQSLDEKGYSASSSLEEFERDYLLKVLRETGGVVAWAATRLRLKRTTLDSRLRRLGISEDDLRSIRKK